MPLIRCDGCGGQFMPGQVHYREGGGYHAGVRWLCGRCHPLHPADVVEPSHTPLTDAARARARASLGTSTLIAADAVETPEERPAPAQTEPVQKRHGGGWPKGLKRSGLRGPAIRPDAAAGTP